MPSYSAHLLKRRLRRKNLLLELADLVLQILDLVLVDRCLLICVLQSVKIVAVDCVAFFVYATSFIAFAFARSLSGLAA